MAECRPSPTWWVKVTATWWTVGRVRPAGKPVEQVRAIRDEIDAHVRRLLAELVPDPDEAVPGVG